MPSFVRLAVSDLSASVEWYRAVGFETVYEMPVMAHLRYRRYADVMLAAEAVDSDGSDAPDAPDAPVRRGRGVSVYFTVDDESVADVADRAAASGVAVGDGPRETPWNTRELPLVDPDGYELVFSEAVDEDRSFEDVMGR